VIQEGDTVTWMTVKYPRQRTEGRVVALMGDKVRVSVGTLGHYVNVPVERVEKVK
jgi:hypothetical protein